MSAAALRVVAAGPKRAEGHRTKAEKAKGVSLSPQAPAEPDWLEWFPPMRGDRVTTAEMAKARDRAKREWAAVVPVLDAVGLLATVDETLLTDHCVTVARIFLCERDVSRRGMVVESERGHVRNPSVSAANQYRQHLRHTMAQLGLTPAARAAMHGRSSGGEEGDDPFD